MCRSFVVSMILYPLLSGSWLFAQDSAEVVAEAEKSLLKIEVRDVGQGSGYVVDSSGIAVTNVHVMAGAQTGGAVATFPDGTVCEITGSYLIDPSRDIAVIQLDTDSLKPLPIADAHPRKGEEVIALGSPLGLSFTATRGIISAIRTEEEMKRDLDESTIRGTWIQVDAPLSPGNSGGPLINKDGKLVAMSTRASFGQAQNLNFGISAIDVSEAIASARGKPLIRLTEGLGKIEMEGGKPSSGGIVRRRPVPQGVIKTYVQRGRDSFKLLVKGYRRQLTNQKDILYRINQGRIDRDLKYEAFLEYTTNKYSFRSEDIKNKRILEEELKLKEMERFAKTIGNGNQQTNEGLFALLWKFGPSVNVMERGSVGFLSEAKVLRALTENDVIIKYQGGTFVLWVADAAGLSDGATVSPAPVFVVGAKTIADDDGNSIAVTILYTLTEAELRQAVFGTDSENKSSTVAESGSTVRKWRDTSGKFEVEATLIDKDTNKIVLKKKDGSIITVPVSKLSPEDLQFLKSSK